MKSRCGYKCHVIEAQSHELREGGFSTEFFIEEHDAIGAMETRSYLPDTFPTQDAAIEAGIQAERQRTYVRLSAYRGRNTQEDRDI